MADDASLMQDFINESKEHLERIEEQFLQLEAQGAGADADLVNTVFRAIHSIKGAAGFLGLERIQTLAHVSENVLDRVRNRDLVPDPDVVSALLSAADQLRAMIDDVAHSNQVDVSGHLARLSAILDGNRRQMADVENLAEVPVELVDAASGQPVALRPDPLLWASLPHDYSHYYLIRFNLTEREISQGKDPLTAMDELNLTGAVLDSRMAAPEADLRSGLPTAPLMCEVLYATVFDPGIIAGALGVGDDAVRRLKVARTDLMDTRQMREAAGAGPRPETVLLAMPTPAEPTTATALERAPARPASPPPGPAPQPDAALPPEKPPTRLIQKEEARGAIEAGARGGETLRLSVERIDRLMALAGELVLVRNRALIQFADREGPERQISQQLDMVTSELQEAIMGMRMQPIGQLFNKLPRIVRDLSKKLGKKIELATEGNEVEVDKGILEALSDPLVHLCRNACDHGIDDAEARRAAGKPPSGTVRVAARHDAGQLLVTIGDDGRGMDPARLKTKAVEKGLRTAQQAAAMSDKEALQLVLLPGFSTAEKVSDISGRGVGMDVVRQAVESFGGNLDLESRVGQGTTITLRLPLTLAIIPSLVVTAGDDRYAIPQTNLEEIVRLYGDDVRKRVEYANHQAVFRLRDDLLPLVHLEDVLASGQPLDEEARARISSARQHGEAPSRLTFAVVRAGPHRFGLVVRDVVGTEEIVVKPMHPALKDLRCYAGSTVMGDGRVALILDVGGIAGHARLDFSLHDQEDDADGQTRSGAGERHGELVFTIGSNEQFALATGLIKRIVAIEAKDIERVADREFVQVDGVITRLIRLDRHLRVSASPERDRLFLLLPRHIDQPIGLVAHELLDVEVCDFDPGDQGQAQDGLLGTAVLRDRITLFVDLFRIAELADPEAGARGGERKKAGTGRTALLAEDTPFFRGLVTRYLESGGMRVLAAADGKQALEIFEHEKVDVVVSDLEMPVMNGFELARAIRRDDRGRGLPLLALTSHGTEDFRAKALEAGFDRFEVKLDRERMLTVLHEMLAPAAAGGEVRR